MPRTIFILVLSLLWASNVVAQLPENFPKIERLGLDGFRLMLQQQNLEATQNRIGTALETPDETVAVILGDLRTVTRIQGQLRKFVDSGGALLIASDLRKMDVPRTPICGAWVKPTKMLNGSDAQKYGFQKIRDCPIVTKFDRRRYPTLFEGVDRIVTNRPSAVEIVGNVRQIAWLPTPAVDRPPIMVTYETQGRMLFLADHSIFINEMLVHGDNARFANNAIRWLSEDGKRTRLILINDGQVLPDWSFGETPPAIPLKTLLKTISQGGFGNLPVNRIAPTLNESIARYQRENRFNQNDVPSVLGYLFRAPRLVRTALFLITGVMILAIVRWLLLRSRARRWLSWQDWTKSSESKMEAAVKGQHFLPYGRTLIREYFYENGAPCVNTSTKPILRANSLAIENQLSRQIEELWKIAIKETRWRMTREELDQTLDKLRRLRQLQLNGELRLEWTPQASATG